MWTQSQEPVRLPEDQTRLLWLVEQEKFRKSLKTFQTVSKELAAMRAEFNKLFEETQSTRAEI